MSEAAELARQALASWNDGTLEAFVHGSMAPDVLLVDSPEMPDARTHLGREAYLARAAEWIEFIGPLTVAIEETVDGRAGTMVSALASTRSPGKSVPLGYEIFAVVRTEDGLITEVRFFRNRQAACAEAGISPD